MKSELRFVAKFTADVLEKTCLRMQSSNFILILVAQKFEVALCYGCSEIVIACRGVPHSLHEFNKPIGQCLVLILNEKVSPAFDEFVQALVIGS